MYRYELLIELAALLLLLLYSWNAAGKASKLVYASSVEALRRQAGKQLFRSGIILLFAAILLTDLTYMAINLPLQLWLDRTLLHAPLVAVPAFAVLVSAVPALLKLRTAAVPASGIETDGPPEPQARGMASSPALVVPFQAVPPGALTALYYALTAPVPFHAQDTIPLLLYLLAVTGLWIRHSHRMQIMSHPAATVKYRRWKSWLTQGMVLAAALLAAAVPVLFAMQASILPSRMSMMAGSMDYGTGTTLPLPLGHAEHGGSIASTATAAAAPAESVSVTKLTGPLTGMPDRTFTLTAEKKTIRLSSGKMVEAWTYNGQSPGPELRMKEGELVQVTLINKNIDGGVTLHWHGLDVPNAEDGVAGATQNAVLPGESYTYRFIAKQAGTFWYHSHQDSKESVTMGLFGPLIVEPAAGVNPQQQEFTVMSHNWNGTLASGASDTVENKLIAPGTPVRMRLLNTDDWVRQQFLLTGAPFQVAAIDGTELHQPETLDNTRLELTTGGRYDVTFVMPDQPVFLSIAGKSSLGLLMSPDGKGNLPSFDLSKTAVFEPSQYGGTAPTPFDASSRFDKQFTMILDNKLGFYNGRFGGLFTINGKVFPNTPMYMVREGDLVKITMINRSVVDHPMHLHGHRMLVLSRNGKPVTGTWWSDTLDVRPGEVYEVAFRADNPGLWMDHCHNLSHASGGMTMHLMYEGVTSPYSIGSQTVNRPE
ncbi:multicopper oxidase family protein [Paenibacillus filicis]|uniref:Multicopper oxidase family protein n=1 Tax=Paenibacillus gyeongsangnamensis TaxID=3388067 RepID=A0ABT4QIV1_9BACL|nr:multicopper oxidase family protein [Paenibacillus filicis]MCZ8516807.1 multicopper oxidase family protein [Paenibacillus filicis]